MTAWRSRCPSCSINPLPSRANTTLRWWKASSVERWPIETMVVAGSFSLSSRYSAASEGSSSEAVASSRNRYCGACNSARASPSRCCSPSESVRFQWPCSSSCDRQRGQSHRFERVLSDLVGAERVPSCAGIGDRRLQRSDREIRPLRQHHQRCIRRNGDRAVAERPDAGNRAEQRRLAGAGRAGDQRALVLAQTEAVRGDQRPAVRQLARASPLRSMAPSPAALRRRESGSSRVASARSRCDRRLKSVEPRDHRLPFGQLCDRW